MTHTVSAVAHAHMESLLVTLAGIVALLPGRLLGNLPWQHCRAC